MTKVHRYRLSAALALGVVLGACAEQPRTDDELVDRDSVEEPFSDADSSARIEESAEEAVAMTSTFEPGEGATEAERIDGTVRVFEPVEGSGDYRLAVRLEGIGAGEHAWHIHDAPCGQEGPVVVPFTETEEGPGLAQPLSPGAEGVAEATVTVPGDRLTLERLRSGEYSLHVHQRGGVDHGPTVACANL